MGGGRADEERPPLREVNGMKPAPRSWSQQGKATLVVCEEDAFLITNQANDIHLKKDS